ncbi:MAG: LytTR family transcriptional regulator [Clostridia bacterium]|nr:LytTR family transcriptional regulator [Clostridia bacterium]
MKVEIQIDNNLKDNKVIIQAKEMNEEISELMKKLSNQKEKITVYLGEETYFLKEDEIESVFASDGKVIVKTETQEFQSKSRLYEIEELLSQKNFIRISNSEIVNFDKVKNINTKITGTIVINFFSRLSNIFF